MKANLIQSCCSLSRHELNQLEEINVKQNPVFQKENMVLLPGGEFLLGSNDSESSVEDGETIRRKVTINSFYMDKYAVTNEQFSQFIKETGYVTEAERYGWSFVFYSFIRDVNESDLLGSSPHTPWWHAVNGANWKYPEGRNSSIANRLRHPVVHVSWNDAKAYANWAGKRLPTESEWEYAAASGVIDRTYPWGNELHLNGIHHCNIWQGEFPSVNNGDDGYIGTAPVDSFEANDFGLYNMSGNVWEWCEDIYNTQFAREAVLQMESNVRVIKGGSYLCHHSYCNRYRISARTFNTANSTTGHMGFRCAANHF